MKVFFLDLDFHKKTGSSEFFKDILRRYYVVHEHYANGKNSPDMCTPSDVADCDVVLNWQMTPTMFRAWRLKKPLIFLPMYDGESFNPFKWRRRALMRAGAICFSRVLYRRLQSFGVKSLYVKYYPKPDCFSPGNPRKMFLWARNGLTFDMIKPFINKNSFDEIVVRYSEQMSHPISGRDIQDYHIRVIESKQLKTREEYYELFRDCGVFVAPRTREGIGLSFIEAMSMGKCVIAHDDSTMNEYITDGEDGLLVNFFGTPCKHDLSPERIALIQRNAYAKCKKGYVEWVSSEDRIVNFIGENVRSYRQMGMARFALWLILCPCQFLIDVKNYLQQRFRRR